ncbi:hypothetical protein [Pseudonocardia abyssalis]|uniref:Uncharacterized protein n=1 Tax=Pseudonocardia abyssalis TaxID=2792008 RepID=A0ABS6USK4_9PSEU|nr:hypothetical protein [Pseudonocardia abyssalis]MBW0116838.1 hypothetical protein [Pseudonocardia abyssalis]MBW0135243.1 hypothetical protein [Pseudonocardia abyssalis]
MSTPDRSDDRPRGGVRGVIDDLLGRNDDEPRQDEHRAEELRRQQDAQPAVPGQTGPGQAPDAGVPDAGVPGRPPQGSALPGDHFGTPQGRPPAPTTPLAGGPAEARTEQIRDGSGPGAGAAGAAAAAGIAGAGVPGTRQGDEGRPGSGHVTGDRHLTDDRSGNERLDRAPAGGVGDAAGHPGGQQVQSRVQGGQAQGGQIRDDRAPVGQVQGGGPVQGDRSLSGQSQGAQTQDARTQGGPVQGGPVHGDRTPDGPAYAGPAHSAPTHAAPTHAAPTHDGPAQPGTAQPGTARSGAGHAEQDHAGSTRDHDAGRTGSAPAAGAAVAAGAAGSTIGSAAEGTAPHQAGSGMGDDASGRERLFPQDRAQEYGSRWDAVKGAFVDEPRQAVRQADALVGEVLDELERLFREQRSGLEHGLDTDDTSTEDLRLALRRYRSFFDRLLSL